MNISAADLKALLKKLSVVRTDMVVLDSLKGTLFATSDELRILVTHPALVSQPAGVIQFNGRKLSSAISRLSGILTVTPSPTSLKVVSAKTAFELEALVVKSYNVTIAKPKKEYTLPLPALKQLLKAAAITTQKGAAQFADIIQLEGDMVLKTRGTNNLRMATFFGDAYTGDPFKQIVPVAVVSAVQELSGETVTMGVSDASLDFIEVSGDTKVNVSARLQDKQFPDFSAVTPKSFTSSLKVDAAAMREGLRRISPFIPNDEHKRVDVSFPGDEIKLAATNGGTATDLVALLLEPDPLPASEEEDPFADPPARADRVILNHAYLADFFDAAEGAVRIGMNGGQSPVFLDGPRMEVLIGQLSEE